MKRVTTYTVIAGNKICPQDCPICIAEMTPDYGIGNKQPEINWEKFRKATQIALNHGAQNVLITGKGEPTLFPFNISRYLMELEGKPFDRRELQTEGSLLARGGFYDGFLEEWHYLGLDTVAVSIYHYEAERNKEIFRPAYGRYFDLPKLVKKINSKGLSTRLSCVMLNGYTDSVEEVKRLIGFAKENDVFQLTLRMADKPLKIVEKGNDMAKYRGEFVDEHRLSERKLKDIADFLEADGTKCDVMPHGATVYEIDDQNVCLTTGLTQDGGKDDVRQLIFYPPDWLTTSWENVKGGRIL